MKKIFLTLLLCVSFSLAEINEYMSDVYFANGIDTNLFSFHQSSGVTHINPE